MGSCVLGNTAPEWRKTKKTCNFLFVKESTVAYCVCKDKWPTRSRLVTSGTFRNLVSFETSAGWQPCREVGSRRAESTVFESIGFRQRPLETTGRRPQECLQEEMWEFQRFLHRSIARSLNCSKRALC